MADVKANTGGAAFPTSMPESEFTERGMSLRDYFAAQSVIGLVQYWGNSGTQELAKRAYELADAMLAERDK